MRSLSPGDRVARYIVEQPLGSGGMAEVVQALDTKLGRRVALKRMLRHDDDVAHARLMREARAAAALDHPNVVAIFDVGELDGAPFIAMELVVGVTLRKYVGDASVSMRRRITWLVEIARALAAAHERGLVHRDVKPENVMVREDGAVKVLDFGIARAATETSRGVRAHVADGAKAHSETITRDDTVVGTTLYMAPEHARGDGVDARADQFAWALVAYELLTGAHPWGASASSTPEDILAVTLFGEPPSLAAAAPDAPAHVVGAVMRALSKRPESRFATMDALVDAMTEGSASLPRVAVPATATLAATTAESRRETEDSTATRLVVGSTPAPPRQRLSRARVAALALVVVALAAGAGRYVLRARADAADKENAALQVGGAAARLDATVRRSALSPLHDTRRDRAEAEAEMRRIEDAMARSPFSRATGAYALGRAYLALREPERAREQLERAAAAGVDPRVEEALGDALGVLYRDALLKARRVPEALREDQLRDAATTLRDPALAHLAAARGAGATSDRIEGLIALYERRFDDAIRAARAAFARDPLAYEAKELEGDIEYSQAGFLHIQGKNSEAYAAFERAGEAFEVAIAIARSSAPLYTKNTRRHAWQLEVGRALGKELDEHYTRAIEASDKALVADPDDVRAWRARAEAARIMANYESGRGKDPGAPFTIAVEAARRATALAPDDDDAHITLAETLSAVGMHDRYHGADPTASLEEAIREYERGLARGIESPWQYNGLGRAREALALYRSEQGLESDPRLALRASIDAYRLSAARYPAWPAPHINACNAGRQLAEQEMFRGIDPRVTLDAAADAADVALRIDPSSVFALCNRGLIDVRRGEAATIRGDDASSFFAAAMPRFDDALKRNPRHAHGFQDRGDAWLARAVDERTKLRDPTPALREAVRAFEERLKLDPKSYWAERGIADAWRIAANEALASGKSPTAAIGEAERAVEAALRLKAGDHAVQVIAADLALVAARAGDDASLARGASLVGAVLDKDPNDVDALRVLAELHRERARRIVAHHGNAADAVRIALDACARVDAILPGDARAQAIGDAVRILDAHARGDASAESAARADLAVAMARDARVARDFGAP